MVAGAKRTSVVNKPSLVDYGDFRFLIIDSPNDLNVEAYTQELCRYKVAHVARACERNYSPGAFEKAGIRVHELEFEDGAPPPEEILSEWLDLVAACMTRASKNKETYLGSGERIAVHCVAGLGRAPMLVAVALIEFAGMDASEAVDFIRERRRGAINTKQLRWLINYQPTRRGAAGECCVIA